MKVKQFHDLNLVDFIKMFEMIGDDDECEPVCDFGVFMSQDSSEVNLKTGDLLISIDEDDFLDKTSAQVVNYIKRLEPQKIISVTIGRKPKWIKKRYGEAIIQEYCPKNIQMMEEIDFYISKKGLQEVDKNYNNKWKIVPIS